MFLYKYGIPVVKMKPILTAHGVFATGGIPEISAPLPALSPQLHCNLYIYKQNKRIIFGGIRRLQIRPPKKKR